MAVGGGYSIQHVFGPWMMGGPGDLPMGRVFVQNGWRRARIEKGHSSFLGVFRVGFATKHTD